MWKNKPVYLLLALAATKRPSVTDRHVKYKAASVSPTGRTNMVSAIPDRSRTKFLVAMWKQNPLPNRSKRDRSK